MVTAITLKAITTFNFTISGITAFRAQKTIGPACSKNSFSTLLFISIGGYEIWQTHTFLELDIVLAHNSSPYISND